MLQGPKPSSDPGFPDPSRSVDPGGGGGVLGTQEADVDDDAAELLFGLLASRRIQSPIFRVVSLLFRGVSRVLAT